MCLVYPNFLVVVDLDLRFVDGRRFQSSTGALRIGERSGRRRMYVGIWGTVSMWRKRIWMRSGGKRIWRRRRESPLLI
jgi:hypothetical protein